MPGKITITSEWGPNKTLTLLAVLEQFGRILKNQESCKVDLRPLGEMWVKAKLVLDVNVEKKVSKTKKFSFRIAVEDVPDELQIYTKTSVQAGDPSFSKYRKFSLLDSVALVLASGQPSLFPGSYEDSFGTTKQDLVDGVTLRISVSIQFLYGFSSSGLYRISIGPDDQGVRDHYARIKASLADENVVDFIVTSSDGRTFPALRSLLKMHSPVFAAMLTHDSKENREGRCVIKDLDGQTVEAFLNYMHLSKLPADPRFFLKLLPAAAKYQVDELVKICADNLEKDLKSDNAGELLILTANYQIDGLHKTTTNFIADHFPGFLTKGQWDIVRDYDEDLANDLLKKVKFQAAIDEKKLDK